LIPAAFRISRPVGVRPEIGFWADLGARWRQRRRALRLKVPSAPSHTQVGGPLSGVMVTEPGTAVGMQETYDEEIVRINVAELI